MGRHKKDYQHGSFRTSYISDKYQGEAEDKRRSTDYTYVQYL